MRTHVQPSPRFDAWVRAMVRWRWLVIAVWLVVVTAGVLTGLQLTELLSNRYNVPGSDADRVEAVLADRYGQLSEGGFQVVVQAGSAPPEQILAVAAEAGAAAAAELPDGEVVGEPMLVGEDLGVVNVVTALEQADSKAHVDEMRDAVAARLERSEVDATAYVTGGGAFAADLDPILNEDLKHGELYFALPIALVVLAFTFGSLGFLLPFLFAVAAIPASLLVTWAFATQMNLSVYVLNMVVGIGLGVSIDYSLLVFWRYREERVADGRDLADPDVRVDAVVRTMATAGRAVVFSGLAVAIGLATLLMMPLPFIRGFGVAGLVIPLMSIVATLTLMPGVLYLLAHRLERVRFVSRRRQLLRDEPERSGWARLARTIMRRPWPVFLASGGLLVLLALPLGGLSLTPGGIEGLPEDVESVAGSALLDEQLGEGAGTPTVVIVDAGAAGAAGDPEVRAYAQRLHRLVVADDEVVSATPPDAEGALDPTGRYLRIDATGANEYGERASREFVERLREDLVEQASPPDGVEVMVGGSPALGVDLIDTTYRWFPWLVALVLLLTWLLLLRAFRSLLLPLKAIILNMLSISAAMGLLVAVFTTGAAEAVGLERTPEVAFWVPVFLFAVLFGLSMDYEVFLVSRMREAWDETGDNEHAVALGLARTGRIVTAAGLIMMAAFGGFMLASTAEFQQFGFGLATAILIDVTLVRALLLPSAMKLFGRWNWWLPARVARIARVEPSPLRRQG